MVLYWNVKFQKLIFSNASWSEEPNQNIILWASNKGYMFYMQLAILAVSCAPF